MTDRLIYAAPTFDRTSSMAVGEAGVSQVVPLGAHENDLQATLQALFQQLAQSLAVLSGTAELVMEGKVGEARGQALRVWLQPNARQAEVAMHQLRDMRLTKSPALTELSQNLTVLVLAADMLAQGQLSGADALTFYGLLRRNADGAIQSLADLRGQLLPDTPHVAG
jgi:hypothetical protein